MWGAEFDKIISLFLCISERRYFIEKMPRVAVEIEKYETTEGSPSVSGIQNTYFEHVRIVCMEEHYDCKRPSYYLETQTRTPFVIRNTT